MRIDLDEPWGLTMALARESRRFWGMMSIVLFVTAALEPFRSDFSPLWMAGLILVTGYAATVWWNRHQLVRRLNAEGRAWFRVLRLGPPDGGDT